MAWREWIPIRKDIEIKKKNRERNANAQTNMKEKNVVCIQLEAGQGAMPHRI
jgi:hypothetical protein